MVLFIIALCALAGIFLIASIMIVNLLITKTLSLGFMNFLMLTVILIGGVVLCVK